MLISLRDYLYLIPCLRKGTVCFLAQLHILNILLFVAVVATHDTSKFIHYGEVGVHWLVVGYALRIVAFHYAVELVRNLNGFLLYNLIVLDDAQHYFRSNDRET